MQNLVESFGNGLVQTKPEHLFTDGELLQADNCIYRHDSPSLWAAPGRIEKFSSIDGSGLCFVKFDDTVQYFVWQDVGAATLVAYEFVSGASSATQTSYTAANTLASVFYNNQLLVMNGSNANRVLYHTGGSSAVAPTWGTHGLTAVTDAPGVSNTTGTWPLGTAGLNKYYEYWVTETYTVAGVVIESSAEATAVTTSPIVDATTDANLITLPAPKNSEATSFNIYRSAGKALKTDKQFPLGTLIATVPIGGTNQWLDGGTTVTSYVFPTTATQVSGTWTNPNNIKTDDSSSATIAITYSAFGTSTAIISGSSFSFGTLNDPISGVEVEMETSISSLTQGYIQAAISLDGGTTISPYRAINSNTSITSYTSGGAGDLWSSNLPPAAASLNLVVYVKAAVVSTGGTPTITFNVEHVKARIYSASQQSTGVVAFPAVEIEVAGQTFSVGANGKPPTASTGDVVDGVLVTNDISNPSHVRWSLANNLHAFPSIYLDKIAPSVKCIKRLGQRMAVGLLTELWRYDYMPSEDDATFNAGRARSQVDPNFGIVGPNAACTFIGPDGLPTLAFMSLDGLRGSDLSSTWPLCPDIDWRAILTPISVLDRVIVVNNPRNSELRVYYPGGDTTGLMCKRLNLSYAPMHVKNGRFLKAGGPVTVGTAATNGVTGAICAPAVDTGYSWSTYEMWRAPSGSTTPGDRIWREVDRGTSSATTLAPTVKTRRIYAAGVANEWAMDEVLLHGYAGASTNITPTVTSTNIGLSDVSSALTAVALGTTSGLTRLVPSARISGGALAITLAGANNNNEIRFDTLHFRGAGWGEEDLR